MAHDTSQITSCPLSNAEDFSQVLHIFQATAPGKLRKHLLYIPVCADLLHHAGKLPDDQPPLPIEEPQFLQAYRHGIFHGIACT